MIQKWLAGAAIVACACAVGTVANAEQLPAGLYGAVSGGATFTMDTDINQPGASGSAEHDTGYVLSAALGYRFGNGFRVEGEFGYGVYEPDSVSINGLGTGSVRGGEATTYSLTLNAFYDFDTTHMAKPYIGLGVGAVRTERDSATVTFPGPFTQTAASSDTTDFTMLGEVGINFILAPSIELVPAYRFQWINNGENGLSNDRQHVVKLGLRYSF